MTDAENGEEVLLGVGGGAVERLSLLSGCATCVEGPTISFLGFENVRSFVKSRGVQITKLVSFKNRNGAFPFLKVKGA